MPDINEYTPIYDEETNPDGSVRLVSVRLVEIPDCIAQGRDAVEARLRLESIFPAFVDKIRRLGETLPPPQLGRTRVVFEGFQMRPKKDQPFPVLTRAIA